MTAITEASDFGGLLSRATKFRFNDHPTDTHSGNRQVNQFFVEHRGGMCRDEDDMWAVVIHGQALGSDGLFDYEPIPSSRTDEWRAAHRFPRDTALAIAYRIEQGPRGGRVLMGTIGDDLAELAVAIGRRAQGSSEGAKTVLEGYADSVVAIAQREAEERESRQMRSAATDTQLSGVWVGFYSDWSGFTFFATEIDALRWAVEHTADAKFVKFGDDPRDRKVDG